MLTPALLRSNGSFGDWVPVASRGGQFNASFTDPSFCPFAEELHQLQLYLEGISDTSFFNFTSPRFFIRDIGELNPATAGCGRHLQGGVWVPEPLGRALAPGWAVVPRAQPPLCSALPTVRPDPPQKLTVQQQSEQLRLTWAPPASWPLPRSYFALLYRLQYELSNGTQVTARLPQASLPCPAPQPCSPCPSSASPLAQECCKEQ